MNNNLLNNRVPYYLLSESELDSVSRFREAGFGIKDFSGASTDSSKVYRLQVSKGQWLKVIIEGKSCLLEVDSIHAGKLYILNIHGIKLDVIIPNPLTTIFYSLDIIESVEPLTKEELASVSPKRYRPFTKDELFELQCAGAVLRYKSTGTTYLITGIVKDKILMGNYWRLFSELLDKVEMADGSVCGVEV